MTSSPQMLDDEVRSHQLLCLEHESSTLYAEVIQAIPERRLYWLRPLALLCPTAELHQPEALYDLRQGPDLLCPQMLCRLALDVEVLPVLTQLENLKSESIAAELHETPHRIAHHQLQSFLHRVWQAKPGVFRS